MVCSSEGFLLYAVMITDNTWTLCSPEGVLSNRLCPAVRGPSVFKYLRDGSLVFSDFLHEVKAP